MLGPALIMAGLLIPALGTLYFELNPALAQLPSSDPSSSHRWLYRSPIIRLGEFLAGIGAFVLVSRFQLRLPRSAWMVLLCVSGVLLTVAMATTEKQAFIHLMPYAPLFVVIVVAAVKLEEHGIAVRWRWMLLLGEASFAFYLIHQFYFKLMLLPPLMAAFSLATAQAVVLVAAVSASVGLHLLVEAPARRLLIRLPGRLRGQKHASA